VAAAGLGFPPRRERTPGSVSSQAIGPEADALVDEADVLDELRASRGDGTITVRWRS